MLTFLGDILYVISQSLLIPDIVLLLLLIAYAVFSIGSILVELVTERRHFKVVMPQFLDDLTASNEAAIPAIIEESGLLRRQKNALQTVFDHRNLPGDALIALVRRMANQEESHYDRIIGRNNTAAKVAPMFGLVGTLVPLGPGIQALGQGDTTALSSSLLVAFDTTVAGLVVAAVCLIIAKIRQGWYDNYMSALDSSFATMVQKIEDSRAPRQTIKKTTRRRVVADPYADQSPFDAPLGNPLGASSLMQQPPYATYPPAQEAVPMASVVTGYEAQPQPAYGQHAATSQPMPGQQTYSSSGMPLNPDYDAFLGNQNARNARGDQGQVPGQYPTRS